MAAPPTHPLISAQYRLVALFCPLFLEVSPGTQSYIPPGPLGGRTGLGGGSVRGLGSLQG